MGLLLTANGIVRHYGGLFAVDHVDLHVNRGEAVAVIGPNGSGKTTLFDCLSRVTPMDEGKVVLDGVDISNFAPHQVARQGLSRTFQLIRVYGDLTVLENLALSIQWGNIGKAGLWRQSDSTTIDKAWSLMEFLSLEEHCHSPARDLSGGQRRLLELGMALMPEPSIIMMDEALSGITSQLAEEIVALLHVLNSERGLSILLIEHDIALVRELCSRVVVLSHGIKLAEGTPDEIMENDKVAAAYFGDEVDESRLSS